MAGAPRRTQSPGWVSYKPILSAKYILITTYKWKSLKWQIIVTILLYKCHVLAKGCVPVADCKDLERMETTSSVGINKALGDDMHMQPQQVSVTIRPNIRHEVNFKAKKSQNAVDIYFLLDVSGSMDSIRTQLLEVPKKLIEVSITRLCEDDI